MEFLEFKQELIATLERNSVELDVTEDRIEKLYNLTKIMLEVNASMNLTAITDEKAIILKHYVDSLTVSRYIPNGAKLIDVGCGAGFPCLPLAIFRSDINITALDSTAKRINYISDTAKKLEINNIYAIAARAEEYGKKDGYRESFDIATARAVAVLPVLSELCLPFVKVGGSFVSMKASQGEQEALEAQNSIKICGGKLHSLDKFNLLSDVGSESRVIISISKVSSTPSKYPRHYSQISKKPL